MNVLEVEAREPVTERKREQATSDEAKTRRALSMEDQPDQGGDSQSVLG